MSRTNKVKGIVGEMQRVADEARTNSAAAEDTLSAIEEPRVTAGHPAGPVRRCRQIPGAEEPMSRRTVSDATRELEDLAQSLNPEAYRQFAAEVTNARTAAETFASANAAAQEVKITEARDEVLQKLCEIRDGFDALRRGGEAGRLSAADYQRQWEDLNKSQRSAEQEVERLASTADDIAAIEEDPIAYADRFYSNKPAFMSNFSF